MGKYVSLLLCCSVLTFLFLYRKIKPLFLNIQSVKAGPCGAHTSAWFATSSCATRQRRTFRQSTQLCRGCLPAYMRPATKRQVSRSVKHFTALQKCIPSFECVCVCVCKHWREQVTYKLSHYRQRWLTASNPCSRKKRVCALWCRQVLMLLALQTLLHHLPATLLEPIRALLATS